MKIQRILFFALLLLCGQLAAQIRIDSSFAFGINPAKKYSLYIPSSYSSATANPAIVGFHPFNLSRWDAQSWCDTLLDFSEANDVILICPDGDADGMITDQVDYDFTTALIDSVKNWYNVDNNRLYALGFSVGGEATYEYGLEHAELFGGYIPIGAAVNGSAFVSPTIHRSGRKPFYLVHGANDTPSQRFFPMLTALYANCAYVDSLYMPGIGHTIDFPNRNAILGNAYHWVDSVNLAPQSGVFSLISPISFSNIEIKGFHTPEVKFEWESSSIADSCGVIKYEYMGDIPGGTFASPLFTMPSDNGGMDTTLTLSFRQADSILSTFGVAQNASMTFDWTVRSDIHGRHSDTAKSFRLTLVRRKLGFNLLSPANNTVEVLQNGNARTFDWEDLQHLVPAQYDLLFTDTGGSFSTPTAQYLAGTGGTLSFLSLPHEQIYASLMFGKGYEQGDTLIQQWTANAYEGIYQEYASSDRQIILVKGNVGIELFSPVNQSILQSKKDVNYDFRWDSVLLGDVSYEWLFDTSSAVLDSTAAIIVPSGGNGSRASLKVGFEMLDTIMDYYSVPYLDTLDAFWTVRATNPDGTEYALLPFEIQVFRAHPVGIEKNNQPVTGIRIFPNPASSTVRVRWTGPESPVDFQLISSDGKRMIDVGFQMIGYKEALLDISQFQQGKYVLRMKFRTKQENIPLIISH